MQPAPHIPAGPSAPFRCEHYACTLAGRVCVERQRALVKHPGAKFAKVPLAFQFCASGQCRQGVEVARRLKGWAPAPSKAATQHQEHRAGAAERLALIEQRLLARPTAATTTTPAAPAEETRMARICVVCRKGITGPAPEREAVGGPKHSACETPKKAASAQAAGRVKRAPKAAEPADAPATPPPPPGDQSVEELLRARLAVHRAEVAKLQHHADEVRKLEAMLAAAAEAA